jgi:hypothetical protein
MEESMRKLMLFASAAMMIAGSATLTVAKGGPGGGGGGGHGPQNGGGHGAGPAGGPGHHAGGGGGQFVQGGGSKGHGAGHAAKGEGGPAKPMREARGERHEHFAQQHGHGHGAARMGKGPTLAKVHGDKRAALVVDRTEPARVTIAGREHFRWQPDLLPGCPPGLAKKNNGCLPPGQAKKIYGDTWFRYAPWYGAAAQNDWQYANGYAYRLDPSSGLVNSFLPLLGGGLYPGNVWPTAYNDYAVDPYYRRFYGYGDDYDYRYADGTLFAVDPRTQQINSIAALLTGDPWAVGQPMPTGYDAYNVPPLYRDRYYDTSDAWYRYNDGYVYQVDPTTQLVSSVISLLT